MDADLLRRLAADVSSDDIAIAREATTQLQTLLAPAQVISMLQSPPTAAALESLLVEVEEVGSHDVFKMLGTVLESTFARPSPADLAVLYAPEAQLLIAFVVRTVATPDAAIAASMLAALRRVIACVPTAGDAAARVGDLLDAALRSEYVFRLFNCDAPEDAANAAICAFLHQHTGLLPFLLEATQSAFESDPLLLANYLVVSGVVCCHVPIPSTLRITTMAALHAHDDVLHFAFVCRFWALCLRGHESNGQQDAAACVSAVAPLVCTEERDEAATEAAFEMIGAAASTKPGWDATVSLIPCATLQTRLCSTSASLRLSTLNLLLAMLISVHVETPYFTKDLLMEAWQSRTSPDDEVRLTLWRVMLRALSMDPLEKGLAAVCASFLCSGVHEENPAVRTAKLQAANRLLNYAALPENVKGRLSEFVGRGLYPAGSSGVALMTKD